MKIVCFILLVTFCVYGKTEDPAKPAAPAAVPAPPPGGAPAVPPAGTPVAPAAGTPLAKVPPAGLPGSLPAMPGLSDLTAPVKAPATDSVGMVGYLEGVKNFFSTGLETTKRMINTAIDGNPFQTG